MPPADPVDLELFPEADRQVFAYHDGTKVVFGDPLAIDNRYFLAMADEDLDALNDALRARPDPRPDGTIPPPSGAMVAARVDADERMAEAVRAAFKLAPFDEATGLGLPDAQVQVLWGRYQGWKDALQKKAANGPSTPPSSAASPASSPTEPAASGT